MRRFALAIAAVVVILVASAIGATRAVAMSMTTRAGLAPAINESAPTEQVYWRRHGRRHYWRGWGWPRHFWWSWRRFWSGFPFFGPHGAPHHVHHRRAHKPAQQKQGGEEQKQEEPQQR